MSESPKLPFKHYTPKEDHPDWAELHAKARAQVEEILPLIRTDADATLGERAVDRWRGARSVATAGRNYLINRRRWKQGNHALRPLYFIWSMLYHCNFRCTYCDDHRGKPYFDLPNEPLSFEDRKRVLETMRTGTSAVYFCGGEPTLDEKLPELADTAWHLGYKPLMINTNGFILNKVLQRPTWANWLRQMDIIIISLDGLSIPRLKELWGVKGVEQVLVNLLMMRELRESVGFKLVVNTVIGPDSVDMASDVLDFANDLGIWFVPVPVHCHEKDGEGFSFARDLLHREDYRKLADTILERKRAGYPMIGSTRILELLLNVKPYTCLPTLRPHVDADGRIAWPCRAMQHGEPEYFNLLDYDSVDACWAAAHASRSATDFHGPGPEQCGDMCAWMQNYSTARYHDVLTDPLHAGLVSEVKEFAFTR